MTPTKVRAVDAAVELLGTEGLRALTHTRVDARAGLPRGSTSNYFRTRKALLAGVVDRLAELDIQVGEAVLPPSSAGELVDGLVGMLEEITGRRRVQTTARLVLFLEASHDPDLREALSTVRRGMESTLVVALASLGAADPVTATLAVAACCEGLILHRIARHDETDPRPVLEAVVRAQLPSSP